MWRLAWCLQTLLHNKVPLSSLYFFSFSFYFVFRDDGRVSKLSRCLKMQWKAKLPQSKSKKSGKKSLIREKKFKSERIGTKCKRFKYMFCVHWIHRCKSFYFNRISFGNQCVSIGHGFLLNLFSPFSFSHKFQNSIQCRFCRVYFPLCRFSLPLLKSLTKCCCYIQKWNVFSHFASASLRI